MKGVRQVVNIDEAVAVVADHMGAAKKGLVSETDAGPETHDYLVKHLAELGHHPCVERCGVGRDNLMKLVPLGRGLTFGHSS